MGNALEDETLRNVLPENVWRYLTVLYVERRGINLRNDLRTDWYPIRRLLKRYRIVCFTAFLS